MVGSALSPSTGAGAPVWPARRATGAALAVQRQVRAARLPKATLLPRSLHPAQEMVQRGAQHGVAPLEWRALEGGQLVAFSHGGRCLLPHLFSPS